VTKLRPVSHARAEPQGVDEDAFAKIVREVRRFVRKQVVPLEEQIVDRAVQIHGDTGYIREIAVERFYRDVRLFRIYDGTSQIQQLVIAGEMTRGRL
jgi:acyl-CoA dehydrogenase